jgi:SAM-dependent methyltransferase
MGGARSATQPGLLGDTVARDYARKLQLFNACAGPQLRQAIAALNLRPGMRIVDAGCGGGAAMGWLQQAAGAGAVVVGMDLSAPHAAAASAVAPASGLVVQADLSRPPLPEGRFDLVWCVNSLNHVRDPLAALRALAALLRPGGRVALGQSALLPEMFFAWDARLERRVEEAVRRYYRDRYALDEQRLTAVRALVGLMRQAGLEDVNPRTLVIERVSPLQAADERYLLEAVFQSTWGERLRPYLDAADYAALTRLCDPAHAQFALRRPDFHYLQTFTLVTGLRNC